MFFVLGFILLINAFDNNPPLPGRRAGYTYGTGPSDIEIEIIYDLLCIDSQEADPILQEFLDKPFLDSKVRDQIKVTYTFFPLPYHHAVWIPHKLLPFFED